MKNNETRELRAQDDGRVIVMTKTPTGYKAIFNDIKTKYKSVPITQEQFEKYLPYCSEIVVDERDNRFVHYFEPKVDNGLPGWINWLFYE